MAVVGAFLAIRVPGNRIGWLLLAAGSMLAAGLLSAAYTLGSIAAGGTWPFSAFTAWASDVLWVPPIVIVAAGVPLVFPDGHLPSPRWQPVAWLLIVGTIMSILPPALTPGPVNETMTFENPFGIPALTPWLPIADTVSMLTALPAFLGAWAAVVVRFRHGSSVGRHQIKWLLAVALVGVIAFPVAVASELLGPGSILGTGAWLIGFLTLIALPVTIGDRDPPVPAVRDRPDHQPDDRLGDRDRDPRRRVRGARRRAPGGARPGSPTRTPSRSRRRRSSRPRCSSRSGGGSSARWTGGSTGHGTTVSGRPRRSGSGCATRWISIGSAASSRPRPC